ncbi:hypothetical protein [Streptomyces acidiscabies]|uniref:hypothetical protein n=1 Tax=Streptomyces acidiscabies TaxID=42234 RepID=UPI0038F6744B
MLTWVILLFNALMLMWLVLGVNSASDKGGSCGADKVCQDANDVGTAIGAGIIIFIWAAGAVILGVIWLVTNKSGRPARRPEAPPPPGRW